MVVIGGGAASSPTLKAARSHPPLRWTQTQRPQRSTSIGGHQGFRPGQGIQFSCTSRDDLGTGVRGRAARNASSFRNYSEHSFSHKKSPQCFYSIRIRDKCIVSTLFRDVLLCLFSYQEHVCSNRQWRRQNIIAPRASIMHCYYSHCYSTKISVHQQRGNIRTV